MLVVSDQVTGCCIVIRFPDCYVISCLLAQLEGSFRCAFLHASLMHALSAMVMHAHAIMYMPSMCCGVHCQCGQRCRFQSHLGLTSVANAAKQLRLLLAGCDGHANTGHHTIRGIRPEPDLRPGVLQCDPVPAASIRCQATARPSGGPRCAAHGPSIHDCAPGCTRW